MRITIIKWLERSMQISNAMKSDLFCLFVWIEESKQENKAIQCAKNFVCYFQSINILNGVNWNNDSNEKEYDKKIIKKLFDFCKKCWAKTKARRSVKWSDAHSNCITLNKMIINSQLKTNFTFIKQSLFTFIMKWHDIKSGAQNFCDKINYIFNQN